MARTISIGNQSFESIRQKNCFYIDKTSFIKENIRHYGFAFKGKEVLIDE